MTWLIFEEEDRSVAAPAFSLVERSRERLSLNDFYEQTNLVLLFLHGPDEQGIACPDCLRFLETLPDRLPDYESEHAQLLAIVSAGEPVPLDSPEWRDLPVPVLSDPAAAARAKYAALAVPGLIPDEAHLIYVLDLYGVPWAAYFSARLDEPDLHRQILSWLAFIGIQCPE